MFCAQCGQRVTAAMNYCPQCGTPVVVLPAFAPGPDSWRATAVADPPAKSLIARVKAILLSPSTEWTAVAAEASSPRAIYLRYVAPLSAIGVLAGLIGRAVMGLTAGPLGETGVALPAGIGSALVSYLLTFVSVFVVARLIDLLAPRFGGERNALRALKLTAYSYTPVWIAGILRLVPALDMLAVLTGLYGLYLLYVGFPVLMRCPVDKSAPYAIVPALCAITLALAGILAGNAADSGERASDGSSMAHVGEPERGSASTDPATDAELAASLNAVGTIDADGADVEPIDFRKLKELLPETLAGMKRTDASAQSGEAMGIKGSSATARYTDGAGASLNVDISDMASLSGLAGLASRLAPSMQKETDAGYERTSKLNGQIVHERYDRRTKNGEISIILAERFNVAVRGNGVDAPTLRTAISQIDMAGLVALAK